jgi:BMFP domain-containing protein YqiC
LVEVDTATIIIPLLAIVVPVIMIFLSKFGKTSDNTLTSGVRLEGLKANVDNIKEEMERGFNRLEIVVNERYSEMRREFDKTNNKVNEMSNRIDIHEYRLERLEKERDRNSRNWQGGSSADRDISGMGP